MVGSLVFRLTKGEDEGEHDVVLVIFTAALPSNFVWYKGVEICSSEIILILKNFREGVSIFYDFIYREDILDNFHVIQKEVTH